MNRHLDSNEYICSICNKQLATETALQNHLTVHTGEKPFKCDKCEKSFINKTLLTRHSRFHGKNIPVYKCEICDREVATKYHLKAHLLSVHCDEAICQICKSQFSNKEELKDHYKDAHKPFICKTCGKTFTLQRYLKMHEKIHNELITTEFFKCDFCIKKFSKRSIASHVYKSHPEEFNEWRDNHMDLI